MMRRFGAFLILALLLIPLPALAHDFGGTGDCDSWTLNLDGLYGATNITIDGASVPLQLSHEIADTSAATSRSFVVFWDKPSNDVTVTHTLYRQGDCPVVTTTTQPEVTTTTAQVTTTTAEVTTTTAEVTTTTQPTVTTGPPPPPPTTATTVEQCPPGTVHQPPLCVATTVPHFDTTTTAAVGIGTPLTIERLPETGMSTDPATLGALASLALGLGLVALGRSGRKREG